MLSNLIRMRCSLDHLGSPLILCGSCLNEKYRKELKVPLKKKNPNQKAIQLIFLLCFEW